MMVVPAEGGVGRGVFVALCCFALELIGHGSTRILKIMSPARQERGA
jgi:hypothetical protein